MDVYIIDNISITILILKLLLDHRSPHFEQSGIFKYPLYTLAHNERTLSTKGFIF